MSDVSDLKHELKLRRNSFRRWEKYLTRGKTGFRKREFTERYLGRLEKEIDILHEEIKRSESGIHWAGRFVRDIARGVTSYFSPKKPKRHYTHYLFLFALFSMFYMFRDKGSVIGYTVVETVTSNYLSYFLVFILVVCLAAFYKLDKK